MEDIELLEKIKNNCSNINKIDCSNGKCPYSIKVVNNVVSYWGCLFSNSPDHWELDKIKENGKSKN